MICLVSGPTSDSLRSGIHGGAGGGLGQQIDGLLQETVEWRELQVSWTFTITNYSFTFLQMSAW